MPSREKIRTRFAAITIKPIQANAVMLFLMLLLASCHGGSSAPGEAAAKSRHPIVAAILKGDCDHAASLAEAGANANDPEAEYYMSVIDGGEGFCNDDTNKWWKPQDRKQSQVLFDKSVAGGFPLAKIMVAVRLAAHTHAGGKSYAFAGFYTPAARQALSEAANTGDLQAKYLYMMSDQRMNEEPTLDEQAKFVAAWKASAAADDPYAAALLAAYYAGDKKAGRARDTKMLVKYLEIAASSEPNEFVSLGGAYPMGAGAATFLLLHGMELGANKEELAPIINYYANSTAEYFPLLYVATCVKDPSQAFCDQVKVIALDARPIPNKNHPIVAQQYLATLPQAKVEEARTLAKAWKPKKLQGCPDYFVPASTAPWLMTSDL